MQTFDHDDVTIAYDRRGSGPSVLFLHNGGTSSTIWRHQLSALEHDHDVVAVDLPGFGCSPRPAHGIDHRGQVELIGALIDELDLAPVVIVGNCMGSNLAAAVALDRPTNGGRDGESEERRVRALVLVNPLTEATFTAGGLGLLHRMDGWMPGPTRVARGVARRVVPPSIAARMTIRMQLGARGRALGLDRDPELTACNRRREQLPALVDVLDDMGTYRTLDDAAPQLRDLPVCTIWGAQNHVLSPAAGKRLDEQLQPERREVLDDCGHLPMLEQPDRVTSIIETFAAQHQTASPDAMKTGALR